MTSIDMKTPNYQLPPISIFLNVNPNPNPNLETYNVVANYTPLPSPITTTLNDKLTTPTNMNTNHPSK